MESSEGVTLPSSAKPLQSLKVNGKYAGRLRKFSDNWEKITTDSFILRCVQGYSLPFTRIPTQRKIPRPKQFTNIELSKVKESIQELLLKNAIQKCKSKKNQFISSYFLVSKPNHTFRFILNLKALNKFISPPHFKLEDYRSVKNLISQDVFMASIDLKDAYFLIPINKKHRKYLRFIFEKQMYEFRCVPFGLNTAPFLFTKIMKPVIKHLRAKGLMSINYLDDFLLLGSTKHECLANVMATISLLESLGFLINDEKSNLIPARSCKYLGFLFDSQEMTIKLPLP